MKIKHKLSLLSSFFLAILVFAIVPIVTWIIYNNAQAEREQYRENELNRVKLELKDKVEMVAELVQSEYATFTNPKVIEKRYGSRVKNVIETADAILQNYQEQVQQGKLKISEAKRLAKIAIKNIRYDDGVGYVWINDTTLPYPKMIMHPTVPSLDGQVLNDKRWETAENGDSKNLFVSAVNVVTASGEGFVAYQWPKPKKDGGLTEMQPKISYVSLFEPWGWVLGSGVYVDDAMTDGVEKIKETVSQLRYANGEGYFFVISNDLPFPINISNPTLPNQEGRVMDDMKFYGVAMNKTKHLFTAVVEEAREQKNGGFIDYVWVKPDTNQEVDKISYARTIKGLNWVVGSGVYIDNIETNITEKEKQIQDNVTELITYIIGVALLVLVICILVSNVFAGKISKSIEELTSITREISLGKGLEQKIQSTERNDEIGQLARGVERLQTSIKMMMERMKKK